MGELTKVETNKLAKLEKVIEKGMRSFMEVGNALLEIRTSRLYREDHRSFQAYCDKRWGISKPYAHRLIVGSQIAAEIETVVPRGTITEGQVRSLSSLNTPAERKKAWREATKISGGEMPSGRTVERVVRRMAKPIKKKPSSRDWEKYPKAAIVIRTVLHWGKVIGDMENSISVGKLSPEAERFVIHKLEAFIRRMQEWVNEIKSRKQ